MFKNDKITKIAIKYLPIIIIPAIALSSGAAEASEISRSMQPIINALKDLAEPVAYAFMIYGGIKHMAGQSSEGKRVIRDAIGGFILIQWIPWIFGIIRGIGQA